jgi:3-deoxy-D-arabino-heptulosonate 7-phosphate (DAHP) synthase
MTASQPYDFATAQKAQERASDRQRQAEQFIIDTWKAHAEAERAYREALSTRIVQLKADGVAATVCRDIARGEKAIAALKVKSLIAEGVREAASQAAWRTSQDRKAQQTFLEWSMRRDLAEGYSEPTGEGPTYGRRPAATNRKAVA